MKRTKRIQQQSVPSVRSLEAAQHLVACVEAIGYALLRRRILSAIALCSFVWLASLWLSAALAQAQESASNESSITVTQPAPPSMASGETSHLVLGMVDRSELKLGALQNSAAQPANPDSTGQHSPILITSDSRGSEYASLAALASAPSSSQLSAIQAKGAGDTDVGSQAGANKALVYQVGAINFMLNSLPDSFSVSSAGSHMASGR